MDVLFSDAAESIMYIYIENVNVDQLYVVA